MTLVEPLYLIALTLITVPGAGSSAGSAANAGTQSKPPIMQITIRIAKNFFIGKFLSVFGTDSTILIVIT
jgi:hypothetical protein